MVIAGDNVISFEMGEFIDFFEDAGEGASALAAYDVGSKARAKSYGLVQLDGDEVVDFQEKPDDPKSTLVSIACYAFPADVLPLLAEYLEDGNNPDEPGWFIQWLQSRRPVHAFSFDEAWFDIGTAESYLDAVAWRLGGENLIAEGATVDNTTLGENVHVMAGATVQDSTLDRAVVFPDATIRGCEIRNSIVDEHVELENVDFSGALLGAHTTITNPE
jgi:glucose-1-phosphate thymidylyltransferase